MSAAASRRKAQQSEAPQLKAAVDAYMAGDYGRAAELFRPLAEGGNAEAQAWLGSLYASGAGVEVDDAAAFGWYLKAAKAGNPMAQANVGAFYAMGKGVARNDAEAVRWLQRAARRGDPHGQFNLAVLYSKGQGVPEDQRKAVSWYRKAAEKGHYPSQARLGHAYAVGQGVRKSRVQAFVWLSLAAQHGIGTALQALDEIVRQMSSDEKAEGLRLVSKWRGPGLAEQAPPRLNPLPG